MSIKGAKAYPLIEKISRGKRYFLYGPVQNINPGAVCDVVQCR
jgi:hypothetical protein